MGSDRGLDVKGNGRGGGEVDQGVMMTRCCPRPTPHFSLSHPPPLCVQLEEVRDLYRELHIRLERITDFYENNTQQVIDAVAKHHDKQGDTLQGAAGRGVQLGLGSPSRHTLGWGA